MSDKDYISSGPRKFERIQNEIEAMQVNVDNVYEVAKWCGGEVIKLNLEERARRHQTAFSQVGPPGYFTSSVASDDSNEDNAILEFPTLSANGLLYSGDWLIKDDKGRFSSMTNKDFVKEYKFIKPTTSKDI